MIINKLFWQKYRPKNFDGMILLPRIKEQLFDKDDNLVINNNLLFTGGPGLGKSSLAELIIPKSALRINASYNSSVEDLKDTVTEYCKQVGGNIFDEDYNPNESVFKFVYLNEADGLSQKYQEALKAFIEEYAGRIRFILTCNNLNKLSPELRSRFTTINFDPINEQERDFLKAEYTDRCTYIIEKNEISLNPTELNDLIQFNFPDLRSVLNQLQSLVGKTKLKDTVVSSTNIDFFNLIFDKVEPNKTYEWVISNYGDKVEPLLKLCGRYLAEYIMNYKEDKINCLPKILPVVCNYSNQLNTAIDPVILAISCIYDIQTIVHK